MCWHIYRRGKLKKNHKCAKNKTFCYVVEKIARCNDSLPIGKYSINHSNYIIFGKSFIYEVNFCFIFFVFSKTYIIWLVEFWSKYIILLFAVPTYTHLKIKKYGIVRCVLYYYIRSDFRRSKGLSTITFTTII